MISTLENDGTYGLLVSRGSEAKITGAVVNRNASGGILVECGSILEVADDEISGNGGDGITAVEGSGRGVRNRGRDRCGAEFEREPRTVCF